MDRAYVAMNPFLDIGSDDLCRVRDVRAVTDDELLERYASMGRIPPLPPVGAGELEVVELPDELPDAAPVDDGSPEDAKGPSN